MPSTPAGQLIKRVLMVPPDNYTVEEGTNAINPFVGGIVDQEKALQQWTELKNAIEKLGVEVLTMTPSQGLPDQVFACNAGLVYQNNVYLARFRHKERTPEQAPALEWFKANGFKIFGENYPEVFEGSGDAMFSDKQTLWAAYGQRTDKEVYEHVKAIGDFEVVIMELVHPTYYHLDTCFSPVDETTALWYPPAFSKETRKEILHRLPNSIEVTEDESLAFICNVITLGKTVISPKGMGEATKKKLSARGFEVVEVDMSEFLKSGGGTQCVVLRLFD